MAIEHRPAQKTPGISRLRSIPPRTYPEPSRSAPGARADTGVCATRRLNRSPQPGHPWSRCRLPAAGAMPRCRALRQGRPRRPWRRRTAPLRGIATTTGTGAYLAPRHRSRLASRRTLDRSSPARIAKHGTRARLPAPIPRALAGAVLHVALVGAVEHRLLSAIRTSTGTSTYRSTCTSTGSSGTSLTRISASARRRLVSPSYQASPRRLRSLLNFLSSARITDRRFAFGVLPFALTPNVSSSIRAVP